MKKLIGVLLIGLLLLFGCSVPTEQFLEQDTKQELEQDIEQQVEQEEIRVAYLPDGRMVLLQTSGEDVPVAFPDSNLDVAVRENLEDQGITLASEGIYSSDLEKLLVLDARNKDIADLSGLESCVNLCHVELSDNGIEDLSPLGKLSGGQIAVTDEQGKIERTYTSLSLSLHRNNITNITALESLASIDELAIGLCDNGISDLGPLVDLDGLITLHAFRNKITDISPLAGLKNLVVLDLWGNEIEDISPLSGLMNLASMELSRNNIVDITPIVELPKLTEVYLSHNEITMLPDLGKLTRLTYLDLSSNNIADCSSIITLVKGCEVDLEYNPCCE